MKILIIGDGNSIHIYNFVRVVFSDLAKVSITLLDMKSKGQVNKEIYDFYADNNIEIVLNNDLAHVIKNNMLRKIPKINTFIYLFKLSRKVKKLGKFDYCLIHFVHRTKAALTVINRNQYERIVPVFWGSDLLRNSKIGTKVFEKLFQISYKIVFNTENMKYQFKKHYGTRFEDKFEVIKFPTLSFDLIDSIENGISKDDLRQNHNYPLDKHIVMCGHAGFKAEQHMELIDAISKCNENVLKNCYFIFPMTYGEEDLIDQQKLVKSMMVKYGIQGKVLCDFLATEEMLKIVMCTDIYINVIKTDAFSGVMQENLYTNSYLIYGKWLNYYEMEASEIKAQPIDNISDVTSALEYAVTNYELIKLELGINKKLISNISSPKSIKRIWWEKLLKVDKNIEEDKQ